MVPVFLVALALFQDRYQMIRVGKASVLSDGHSSLRFGSEPLPSVNLGNGVSIELANRTFSPGGLRIRRGKTLNVVDLDTQAKSKLKDEAFWGGHKAMNDISYIANFGISTCIIGAVQTGPGKALAILSIRATSPSVWKSLACAIVRIKVGKSTAVDYVRRAQVPVVPDPYWQWFAKKGNSIRFLDGRRLVSIELAGKETGELGQLPLFSDVERSSMGRYVAGNFRDSLVVYDLSTSRNIIEIKRDRRHDFDQCLLNPEKPLALVPMSPTTGDHPTSWGLYDLTSGKAVWQSSVFRPETWWDNRFVSFSGETYYVYSLKDGRLLGKAKVQTG